MTTDPLTEEEYHLLVQHMKGQDDKGMADLGVELVGRRGKDTGARISIFTATNAAYFVLGVRAARRQAKEDRDLLAAEEAANAEQDRQMAEGR